MELGKRLVEELGDEVGRDVTARWMATYLAARMDQAEKDPSAQSECVALILDLWRMRRFFPKGDPLERYNNAVAAFEAAVAAEPSTIRILIEGGKPEPEPTDWAGLARRLQRHTRVLSSAAIDLAVEEDGLRRDDLLDIAARADPDPQTQLLTIIRLVGVGDDGNRILDKEEDVICNALDAVESATSDFRVAYEKLDRKVE